MFGPASDSEFGAASSGGFGSNKNIFTFTLDQGALPVNTTAWEWRELETIDPQVLETATLLEEIGVLPAEVTTLEPKTDEGYESAPSPESIHPLETNFIVEDISNLDKINFDLIFDNTIDEHNTFNIIDANNPVVCPEQEPLTPYNDVCFPMDDENDPNWCPKSPEFTLQKIGVIDDPFLQDAILEGAGLKGKTPGGGSGGVKHRRGQIRMEPTEIKDETHKKNVDRLVLQSC